VVLGRNHLIQVKNRPSSKAYIAVAAFCARTAMATLKQQQISVLTMNTLAFAVNFAVWVMFSVIGIKIKPN
jgi:hypothetical protein